VHWRNSDFQIEYFLAGRCHTADEAYRLLSEQIEDRDRAFVEATLSGRLLAWQLRWLQRFTWLPVVGELVQVRVDRLLARRMHLQDLVDACAHEIGTLRHALHRLEPDRKFSYLPDAQAHQAAQQEEWREELIWRATNYLCAEGRIPAAELATMRLHPDFATHILPRIRWVEQLTNTNRAEADALLARRPALLEK
jgi:hypothetical protein